MGSTTGEAKIETQPDPTQISLSRTIRAAPAQIYAAFTRADGWTAWCCETAEIDPRVGGRLHIYTEGYHAYGEFTRLVENEGLAFTWDGDAEPPTRIEVQFSGRGAETDLAFTVAILGREADWPGFSEFLERTWGRALDNLKEVLEAKGEM